jgi:hypothetical protein
MDNQKFERIYVSEFTDNYAVGTDAAFANKPKNTGSNSFTISTPYPIIMPPKPPN